MVWLTNLLPYRAALAVGWAFAALSFLLAPSLKRTAAARMRQVFGEERSEREIRRLAWLAWRNLCFNGVEAMRIPLVTLDWIKKNTDQYETIERILEQKQGERGVVLAVPHMGNWELAGVAAQLAGAKIMIIVRRQKNPLTNAYLNRLRQHTGVEAWLREARDFSGMVRNLKKEGKVLAILPDLRAKTNAIKVRFLGRDVDIPGGMALFAREAGVPIVPAYVERVGWGRHRWCHFEPIRPDPNLDRDADDRRMTQYVMECFDKAIRAHPDQYFWFNKRWVLGNE